MTSFTSAEWAAAQDSLRATSIYPDLSESVLGALKFEAVSLAIIASIELATIIIRVVRHVKGTQRFWLFRRLERTRGTIFLPNAVLSWTIPSFIGLTLRAACTFWQIRAWGPPHVDQTGLAYFAGLQWFFLILGAWLQFSAVLNTCYQCLLSLRETEIRGFFGKRPFHPMIINLWVLGIPLVLSPILLAFSIMLGSAASEGYQIVLDTDNVFSLLISEPSNISYLQAFQAVRARSAALHPKASLAFTGMLSSTVTWSALLQLTYLPCAIPILRSLWRTMEDTQKSLQTVEPGADTVLSLEPLVRVQKVRFNILRRQFRLLLLHLIVTECWAVYCLVFSAICLTPWHDSVSNTTSYWIWRDNITVGFGTALFAGGISVFVLYTTTQQGKEQTKVQNIGTASFEKDTEQKVIVKSGAIVSEKHLLPQLGLTSDTRPIFAFAQDKDEEKDSL